MAGISTKTVHEIFQTMDYGSSSTNTSTAQVKRGLLGGNYHLCILNVSWANCIILSIAACCHFITQCENDLHVTVH